MRILIVPEDSTVLVDGKHWTHHDMKALGITERLATIAPKLTVKAAHFDDDHPMALIEWQAPQTWITREQYMELFGDVVEDHAMLVLQIEAEAENAAMDDFAQTVRIAEHENKLFDKTRS